MKFNELTIRELRAQTTAVCHKVVAKLPDDKKLKFDFLTVDFIEPMAIEDTEMEGFEYFSVLGRVWLTDKTKLSFKADMVWLGDGCDLAGLEDDNVEFIDEDVEKLIFEY